MPVQLFTNNATTLLDADIDTVVTSLTVTTGEGAKFPDPSGGDWFYATLQAGSLIEIVQVTARSTDVFTIVRGQDGTSGASFSAGATVELRMTKVWFDTVHTEDNLPAADIGDVSGPASAIDDRVAMFDGTSGKVLKDSGVSLSGNNTGDQEISDATIAVTDIADNNATTAKHGFLPKGENTGAKFLRDDIGWFIPPSNTGLPDLVLNGAMTLWQRGTSFITPTTEDYLADGFRADFVTAGSIDVSRIALGDTAIFNAAGQLLNYGLRVDVNTIDASIAAGDFVAITQPVEGFRAIPYMHNVFTVSFLVRANATGTYHFAVLNSGTDRSYVKSYTIDAPDTWELKTFTIPVQDRTGTWNYTNDVGLFLCWPLVGGTDFEGTDGVWNSAFNLVVAGGTNFMADAANNFDLVGVQVDLGPFAQPFRGVPIEKDLLVASRYFQKSYNVDVDPGTNPATNGQSPFISNGTAHFENIVFPVPMRAMPTIVIYSPFDGAVANVYDTTPTATNRAATSNSVGEKSFAISITTSVDLHAITAHYTAEAKL
jgi:hypothetical protein